MEMTRNVKYSEAEQNFKSFGKEDAPVVMLIPGLGVSYVAKPQAKHLKSLCPDVKVEVFKKMNHGQLLIDYPEEIAKRIIIYGEED